jgi:ABC-2 type transport system permease protein
MRQLIGVMRKEFVHIRRDPRLIGYVVGLPVIITLLFGFALRLTVDELSAAVWDQDKTFISMTLKDRVTQKAGLRLVEVDSDQAIRDMLRRGDAYLGLVIPKGLSRAVADTQPSTIRLVVDGSMPTLAQGALYSTSFLANDEALHELLVDEDGQVPRPAPIAVESEILFNPSLRDTDFFLPGTMGIVVMLVSLALTTGLVREKEQQTIEQLWATPMSRVAFVSGKLLPYALVTAADFAMVAILSRLVFDLPFRGSLTAIVVLAALFIVAMLALGSLIASLSETQIQQHFMNIFVFILSIMLSGFVFPLEAIPAWLQPLARILPMTYFVEGIRALTLKGSTFAEVRVDYVALAAFTLACAALTLRGFRKQTA